MTPPLLPAIAIFAIGLLIGVPFGAMGVLAAQVIKAHIDRDTRAAFIEDAADQALDDEPAEVAVWS